MFPAGNTPTFLQTTLAADVHPSEGQFLYEEQATNRLKSEIPSRNSETSSSNTLNSVAWVRQQTILTERPPLVDEVSAIFCGQRVPRGQRHGSLPLLGFLDRSRYYSFQVAPHLYSRGWADPVPDALLLRESSSAGNRIRTSGSVARNPDH
jgi:hypothetical protein